MSQENVELVRRMYEAFHASDVERATSCFSEDVVVDTTARIDGGVGRGHAELNRTVGEWLIRFDDWHEEIEEMRDLGDRVYVLSTQSGRGKDSGVEVRTRYAVTYDIADGLITAMTLHASPD